ncbi:hypothetical protein HNY73_014827 [Argiope bruennichi]|uniref:Uncharacterized protein n=1 Tax=Argiope bruennichi TaxID=94029 RepID=A0A8T0EQJ9_ARGBR|nr:hypothetical protein HNY73_014827 [Argiope bruennichi]
MMNIENAGSANGYFPPVSSDILAKTTPPAQLCDELRKCSVKIKAKKEKYPTLQAMMASGNREPRVKSARNVEKTLHRSWGKNAKRVSALELVLSLIA